MEEAIGYFCYGCNLQGMPKFQIKALELWVAPAFG